MAVAILVLGVPIIDTFWIIVRRVAAHRSPFTPDRGHIHHRLLDLGLSHTQTVLLIYGLCAGLAVLAFVLSGTAQLYAFAVFVVVAGLVFYGLSRRAGGPAADERERRRGPIRCPEARPRYDGAACAGRGDRRAPSVARPTGPPDPDRRTAGRRGPGPSHPSPATGGRFDRPERPPATLPAPCQVAHDRARKGRGLPRPVLRNRPRSPGHDPGGTLAGYWLDKQIGTIPVFVLVGLLVGMSIGARAAYRLITRFLARFD